jgi:Domain of unknown function (DUF4124)
MRWTAWRGLGLALACGVAASVHAATYLCVDAAGKKTFSDRPCPPAQSDATPPSLREAARQAAAEPIRDAPRYGLTYSLSRPGAEPLEGGAVEASCHAPPAPIDRPNGASCHPYTGDTACSRRLPLLCWRDADARSGGLPAQLGASPAVRGDDLRSDAAASRVCEGALGPGWRLARFHDNPGGWRLQARRHASLPRASDNASRYWVAIGDQPGNCWDAPRAGPAR